MEEKNLSVTNNNSKNDSLNDTNICLNNDLSTETLINNIADSNDSTDQPTNCVNEINFSSDVKLTNCSTLPSIIVPQNENYNAVTEIDDDA